MENIQATLNLLFRHWLGTCHSVAPQIVFHSHQWDIYNFQCDMDLSPQQSFCVHLKVHLARVLDLNIHMQESGNFQRVTLLFQLGCLLTHYLSDQIQKKGYCHLKCHNNFHLNLRLNFHLLAHLVMDSLLVHSYLSNPHLNFHLLACLVGTHSWFRVILISTILD